MKALDFNKLKGATDIEKLTSIWPSCGYIYAQEKINGVQIQIDRNVQSTRNKKVFAKDFFPPRFQEAFARIPPGVCLLGELYIPNVPLATLAGAVNVNSAHLNPTFDDKLQIHVWDIHHWYDAPANWSLPARHNKLALIHKDLKMFTHLYPIVCYSPADAQALYTGLCKRPESEGIVYHIPPAYHFMTNEVSTDFIKRKKRHEAEFKCVGVTEGKGKRKGMLGTFVLSSEHGEFKVGGGAGLTDELLDYYYAHPPINQWITISYEEMSVNNLPLRPQFVAVRNYE